MKGPGRTLQQLQPFHPRHCGFELREQCPDPECDRGKFTPLNFLHIPIRDTSPTPQYTGPRNIKIEKYMRRQRAHPGLGLVWWEWFPVDEI